MSQGEHDRQRLLEALGQRGDLTIMGEVLGGVAHELNNALSVAHGNAEFLLMRMQDLLAANEEALASPVGDSLGGNAVVVLEQLLRDARTVARWTETSVNVAGRLETFSRRLRETRRILAVSELVRESTEMIRYRCERENILLIVDFGADVSAEASAEATVEGRFGELQQVLLSLIQNSREAIVSTPREEEEGSVIRVTVESDDHRVRISVTDDGPGIPPELGDEVFEPFFTTATTIAQSASTARGLGLTLARSVAERHGGTLVFEPTEAGTSAVLELPRAIS